MKLELDLYSNVNLNDLDDDIKNKLDRAGEILIDKMFDIIKQKAQTSLHLSKQLYMESLEDPHKVKAGYWEIELEEKAEWIEVGIPKNFDMLPGLLKSPNAKTSKTGQRYIIIPFDHSKLGAAKTSKQFALQAQLKSAMKKMNIPFRKVETTPSGTPKTGLIHKFDVMTKPQHRKHSKKDRQPVGHPLVSKPEGRSYLQGVRVYQKSNDKGKIEKTNMTFRVAHESHKGKKWIHPGLTGLGAFEEARQFAEDNWEEIFENA